MSTGSVIVHYDKQQFSLSGSWIWPCFPGPKISFQPGSSGSWEHRYIAVSGSQVLDWWARELWPRQPQAIHSDDCVRRFDQMLALFQSSAVLSQQRASNLLEGILLELADERNIQPQRRQAWLDDCIRKMSVSNFHNCNYESIAGSWGMSLSTMRRRFRQQMGQSIHQYALGQRMAIAQRRLRESDEPIKSLAAALGYRDVFFFSRQFKQLTGSTPGLYRRSRQQL